MSRHAMIVSGWLNCYFQRMMPSLYIRRHCLFRAHLTRRRRWARVVLAVVVAATATVASQITTVHSASALGSYQLLGEGPMALR